MKDEDNTKPARSTAPRQKKSAPIFHNTHSKATTAAQSLRRLNAFWPVSVTTVDPQGQLDVMHLGGRVRKVRHTAHGIVLRWDIIEAQIEARHPITHYSLLAGGDHA
jgi:hypothetical protein